MSDVLKFTDDSGTVIRGLAIPFGPVKGKDMDGEFFDASTDLCLQWFPDGRPLLFHHGLDGAVKSDVIGRQKSVEIDDEGAWVEAQLDKRSRWYARVKELVEQGALGFSSGAMAHLVRTDRKTGQIKTWPWVELSATPTNAHPGAVIYAVKSTPDESFFADTDDTTTDATDDDGTGPVPFDAHAQRVAADVADFVTRAKARIDTRQAKAGRELSPANRTELDALAGHLATAGDLAAGVRRLLDRTDPGKAADLVALEAELVVSELRRAGHLD